MDIYEHARSVTEQCSAMLDNVGKGDINVGQCWKMLGTCQCICVNVFIHSLLYQAPTFENQFCKFVEMGNLFQACSETGRVNVRRV